VVIETSRADWEANRFRSDLWLYRDTGTGSGSLVALTKSGHDKSPEWSPDGQWIAFLSDRSTIGETQGVAQQAPEKRESTGQVYVIPFSGGEAFPVTRSDEEVHAFAWSADSRVLYFATRVPWNKKQKEAYKEEWRDVVQFREQERGDVIRRINIFAAQRCASGSPAQPCEPETAIEALAATPFRVKQLEASPDGRRIAFLTQSRTERWESLDEWGIYLLDMAGGEPQPLVRPNAFLDDMRWNSDSRCLFFSFTNGSVKGPYQDTQPRIYCAGMDRDIKRWAAVSRRARVVCSIARRRSDRIRPTWNRSPNLFAKRGLC
jgi:dipeptidyl aminopeptidase/acylaminoacyl peptidase